MLTRKQHELLMLIHERIRETGVPPSFEEMKELLDLSSKSGVHRLITALEERGFIRRLPQRARALEVIKLPPSPNNNGFSRSNISQAPVLVSSNTSPSAPAVSARSESDFPSHMIDIPVMGRIAAGTPISAIQEEIRVMSLPQGMLPRGEVFALEVRGDSMINAGIFDGDVVVVRKTNTAQTGEIVVALIDGEEATLKRLRRRGNSIALEAANPEYETRIYGQEQVVIQGKLVTLVRQYQ